MFRTNRLSGNACPTTAVTASATTIEMIAISIGIATPNSVPTTSSSTIECRRQPELQLALAQVARGELLEVAVERVAARDVRRESRAAVRALHGRDEPGDPLVLRLGEDDRQHGGVAVGRHEDLAARIQVAGDALHPSAAAEVRRQRAHARLEGGIRGDEVLGPHDDELVDRLLIREAARR